MIHLFAERNTVKLIQHGLVETLADPIGLGALGLGAGMINVLDREVELILVPLWVPAVFAPPVGQHAHQLDSLASSTPTQRLLSPSSMTARRRSQQPTS